MKGCKVTLVILLIILLFGLVIFIITQNNLFFIAYVNCKFQGYNAQSTLIENNSKELIGKKYYDCAVWNLKKTIKNIDTVEKVQFKYSSSQTLTIIVSYKPVDILISVIDDDNNVLGNYIINNGQFETIENSLSNENKLYITESIFNSLQNKGITDEFYYILYSVKHLLTENSLITNVKYVNNSIKDFSWINFEISSLNIFVQVREPVSLTTLLNSSKTIMKMGEEAKNKNFDLYPSCLVERN